MTNKTSLDDTRQDVLPPLLTYLDCTSLRESQLVGLGGKAGNLARLSSTQYCVPSWFCVTSFVHERVVGLCREELTSIISTVDYESYPSVRVASTELKKLIRQIGLPPDDWEAIQACFGRMFDGGTSSGSLVGGR